MFRRRATHRVIGLAVAALALSALAPVQPASAQGLFEALFGGFSRRAPAPLPSQTSSFVDPLGLFGGSDRPRSGEYGGGGTAYCVRTCDGRFFPLQRHSSATSVELCKSFCPASKTMVFNGSKIDHAVASNGTRYADLDNAFVYRERVVDNCTCNGKDALGLARVDLASDPTLRAGDIVATADGLATYKGINGRSKTAEFTPISASSSQWAKRLSEIKVTPNPEPKKVTPVVDDTTGTATRRDRRRAAQSYR